MKIQTKFPGTKRRDRIETMQIVNMIKSHACIHVWKYQHETPFCVHLICTHFLGGNIFQRIELYFVYI